MFDWFLILRRTPQSLVSELPWKNHDILQFERAKHLIICDKQIENLAIAFTREKSILSMVTHGLSWFSELHSFTIVPSTWKVTMRVSSWKKVVGIARENSATLDKGPEQKMREKRLQGAREIRRREKILCTFFRGNIDTKDCLVCSALDADASYFMPFFVDV